MSLKRIELDESDIHISRYEQLPLESIRRELEEQGVDAQATINSVKALISRALGRIDHAPRRK
jgi:hypothetical protein